MENEYIYSTFEDDDKVDYEEDCGCDDNDESADEAFRIEILERAFNLVEEVILKCYKENDEKNTLDNIAKYLDDLERKAKTKKDALVLKDARRKFDALSYDEIAELYELLN